MVFSQDFQISCQWDDGINRLAVAGQIIVHHIHIEQVFPFLTDDGKRLDLRQVDLVEGEDGQYMTQTALFVRKGEDDVPCITLNSYTEHVETVKQGTNVLVGEDAEQLKKAMHDLLDGNWKKGSLPDRWDGRTAERIVQILRDTVTTK